MRTTMRQCWRLAITFLLLWAAGTGAVRERSTKPSREHGRGVYKLGSEGKVYSPRVTLARSGFCHSGFCHKGLLPRAWTLRLLPGEEPEDVDWPSQSTTSLNKEETNRWITGLPNNKEVIHGNHMAWIHENKTAGQGDRQTKAKEGYGQKERREI